MNSGATFSSPFKGEAGRGMGKKQFVPPFHAIPLTETMALAIPKSFA
jgi:hypothetical protein